MSASSHSGISSIFPIAIFVQGNDQQTLSLNHTPYTVGRKVDRDLVIADPPYAETRFEWDRWPDWWPDAADKCLKSTGSMWCFGSFKMFIQHWREFGDHLGET